MEIREFAESILFARSLDAKLADPGDLTDADPGPPRTAPDEPGRPAELRFKPRESSADASQGPDAVFPGTRHLDRGDARGRVLHYFANHELLAVELMALALVRFPDAPPAFRRGLLKTLRDEQEHTRWYVQRMRECGVAFGELPVSGHLWRLLARMESPLDYVSGLPLTFEQANLDFSREYGRAFAAAGDAETAALLDRIHRDEIVHVGFGLKWFRRWKDPALGDWEAFEKQLRFPLSPSRAKGRTLNLDGRRAAGLDDAFIAELRVFGRSRGRAPTVHWFNPLAEHRIAAGAGFEPNDAQRALVRDLALLPTYLASHEDVVLVPGRPDSAFLAGLQDAGFDLPEFEVLDGARLSAEGVRSRALGGLRPWAWAPDSLELLGPLVPQLPESRRPALPSFGPVQAALYGKAWSAAFLRDWLTSVPAGDWLCGIDEAGVAVASWTEFTHQLGSIRARGHHRVVVKADLGLAGSGMIRLWEHDLLPAQRRWIESHLDAGRRLVVEPWLERIADFSVQLHHEAGDLRILGYTGLENDLRGQFCSNWAEPRFHRRPPMAVIRALAGDAFAGSDPGARVHRLFEELASRLAGPLAAAGHVGALGIDAFVYRDATGRSRLKPIVEINPRHTMGRVTLGLMQHVAPGRRARFRIVGLRDLREAGDPDFVSFAARLRTERPWRREGSPVPRLVEGALCLTDPARAERSLAVLEILPGVG